MSSERKTRSTLGNALNNSLHQSAGQRASQPTLSGDD